MRSDRIAARTSPRRRMPTDSIAVTTSGIRPALMLTPASRRNPANRSTLSRRASITCAREGGNVDRRVSSGSRQGSAHKRLGLLTLHGDHIFAVLQQHTERVVHGGGV